MPEQQLDSPLGDTVTGANGLTQTRAWWRWVGYSALALACTLIFGLYIRPDMMVTLADQLWACF